MRKELTFSYAYFADMYGAQEYIKKILAELPKESSYLIIHSISSTECEEDGGDWEDTSTLLLDFLRDLDSQQGYTFYFTDSEDGSYWDWMESEKTEQTGSWAEIFVDAGEGVYVYHASEAEDFPVIVLKKNFVDVIGYSKVIELLNDRVKGEDFTKKLSPALFIEIFD